MTKARNWLTSEYQKAGIEGLRIATVMGVLTETLAEAKKTKQFDKKLALSKNLSVLLHGSGTFEIYIGIKGVLSTHQVFKMNEAKPLNQEIEDMAKISALATYVSSDVSEASQYDNFMVLDTLEDSDIDIWEPFEYRGLEEIQELVEAEFSTTLQNFKKIISLTEKVEANIYGYEERINAAEADMFECPMCGSQEIKYGDPEPDGLFIYRIHECKNCKFTFEERYALDRVKEA
ncbi:MAG: hypothetical protein PHI38_10165 [Sulfurimonas sp.]|uniref:hypothetical protein n=1 Tax=Sulfurimonas sp. TaxID=2022749 RepID=UPI00260C6FF5|nr:hypothetical protein [Sulfurimonas sp.]MDD3477222.1 hypothetical protein [Sulfurimonas sp.]